MIARTLGIHPEICAFHEPIPHLNTAALFKWSGKRDSAWVMRQIELRRAKLIEQVMLNRFLYVESSHYLSHLIPELDALFDAKYIHIYRNGLDFVDSGLKRGWYARQSAKGNTLTFLRRTLQIELGHPGRSFIDHRLPPPSQYRTRAEKLAWLWTEINGLILASLAELPGEKSLSIRLESFDQSEIERLAQFLEIEISPSLVQEMMGVARTRPNKTVELKTPTTLQNLSIEEQTRVRNILDDMMHRLEYVTETESKPA